MRFVSEAYQTNSNNVKMEHTSQVPNTVLQLSIRDTEEGMAQTPKDAVPQTPRRLVYFEFIFCRQRTPVASRATLRRPGADIKTPVRWRIVTDYQKLSWAIVLILSWRIEFAAVAVSWADFQQPHHPETRAAAQASRCPVH